MEAGEWGKELLVKEKKRIVSGQDIFFLGGREHKFFLPFLQITSSGLIRKFQIDF